MFLGMTLLAAALTGGAPPADAPGDAGAAARPAPAPGLAGVDVARRTVIRIPLGTLLEAQLYISHDYPRHIHTLGFAIPGTGAAW